MEEVINEIMEYVKRKTSDFSYMEKAQIYGELEIRLAALDEFQAEGDIRGYQLPIMPDYRKKPDKLQRIESVAPFWERGQVYYNEALKDTDDMQVGIDQTLSLEHGSRAHDDAPDADEGAIYILQKQGRLEAFVPRIGERQKPRNTW